jgi:hypothetical protein
VQQALLLHALTDANEIPGSLELPDISNKQSFDF